LAINGQSCSALSTERVKAMLHGEPGSDVVLEIARGDEQSTATLALEPLLTQVPEQPQQPGDK
jgi:C-terminal processing protease CtpA/Prc